MPLYEYQCQGCQTRFEKLVRFGEEVHCPRCESQKLEKLMSVFAVNTQGAAASPKEDCGNCSEAGPGGCPYAQA